MLCEILNKFPHHLLAIQRVDDINFEMMKIWKHFLFADNNRVKSGAYRVRLSDGLNQGLVDESREFFQVHIKDLVISLKQQKPELEVFPMSQVHSLNWTYLYTLDRDFKFGARWVSLRSKSSQKNNFWLFLIGHSFTICTSPFPW